MQRSNLENFKPVSLSTSRNAVNSCAVASASPAWAAKIFPGLNVEQADEKLWQTILETNHAVEADPVAAWEEHIQNLRKRTPSCKPKMFGLTLQSPRH